MPTEDSSPYIGYLEVKRLGRTEYLECHELQRRLVDERIKGTIGDVLVLTEHEPVITLGRGVRTEHEPSGGVAQIEVERGGEATYHGPGQVVAYPIFELEPERRDLHRFLRDLEEVVLGVLAEFEVEGRRREGLTGVWIGERKICSVGIAVKRWVTWHGLAVNVTTDLAAFEGFRPCGLDPEVMTRLVDHVQLPPTNVLVEVLLVKHFCRVFGMELPPTGHPRGDTGFSELPIFPG